MMSKRYTVLRMPGSRTWGVYETSTGYNRLVEGGFFSKDAALDCAATWRRDYEMGRA